MKNYYLFGLLSIFLLITSCKKTEVDATSIKTFQNSVNDLESSLPTVQQIKFNEALYILKTFGVPGDDDLVKLKALAKLLDGKKIPEIFAIANQVAKQNNVDWASTNPPSLGEMNIFSSVDVSERDPNEVEASSLSIKINPIAVDSILGAKALQIVPRLLNDSGQPITFDGSALETILEVSSNGTRLLTSKNLMTSNNFKGFTLKFASLPVEKIVDDKIEVKVSVKSSKKTYQMIKTGVSVNSKALLLPVVNDPDETVTDPALNPENIDPNTVPGVPPVPQVTTENPKTTVTKFLNNLGSQNLRAAYDASENAAWGNFDKFSNPNSGFGAVKNLNIGSVVSKSTSDTGASVNATYNVTDKSANTVALDVTYGLKNINGTWKISNYKINSSTKK